MKMNEIVSDDVFILIFNELDGISKVKCSKVCLIWNQEMSIDRRWKFNCKKEIEATTLDQILLKAPLDLKLISWKQIYKSWYISTNSPKRWTLSTQTPTVDLFKESELQDKTIRVEQVKIYKGYIIVNLSKMMRLFSLKTKKILDTWIIPRYSRDLYFFLNLQLDDRELIILWFPTQLLIVEIEEHKITNFHTPFSPFQIGNKIFDVDVYANYVCVRTNEGLVVCKCEPYPVNFKYISIRPLTLPSDFANKNLSHSALIVFWNDILIVVFEEAINLYSIVNDNVIQKASFTEHAPGKKTLRFQTFLSTPTKIISWERDHRYEIDKKENDYFLNRVTYEKDGNDYWPDYFRIFSNIIFAGLNHFVNSNQFHKISDLNSIIEIYSGYKLNILHYEVCFCEDELVIVSCLAQNIVITTFTLPQNHPLDEPRRKRNHRR